MQEIPGVVSYNFELGCKSDQLTKRIALDEFDALD